MMLPYDIGDYTFMGFDAYKLENANTVVRLKVESASQITVIYMPAQSDNSNSKSKMQTLDLSEIEKMLNAVNSVE